MAHRQKPTTPSHTMPKILNKLKTLADEWDIKISKYKTEIVIFNHRTAPAEELPKLQIDGQEIQYKTNTKLLGMTFDNELSWKNISTK